MASNGVSKKTSGMHPKSNVEKKSIIEIYNLLKKITGIINNFYYRNKNKKNFELNKSKKRGYDPVTIFDKNFEKIIKREILKKFKDHSILGEEFGKRTRNKNFLWVIDPIDGTKSFIAGNPTWGNLVSIHVKNIPLIGLANFPILKKFYLNDPRSKKTYVHVDGKKTLCKVSKIKNFNKIKIAGSMNCFIPYFKKPNIRKITKLIQFQSFDSLTIGNFLEGRIDMILGCGNKFWDIHPFIPLIKGSGGIITTWENQCASNAGNILISNNEINHKKMLTLLKILK